MDLHSRTARSNDTHLDIEGQIEETPLDGDRHPDTVNVNGERRESGSNEGSIHREADRNQEERLNRPVLNVNRKTDKYTDRLFNMLHAEGWDEFISTVEDCSKDNEFNINCSDGIRTYLQLACFIGIEKVVKYLLDKGADLNTIGSKYTNPPILVAGEGGKLDIVKLILERYPKQLIAGKKCYNLLHAIVRGAAFCVGGDSHVNCLTYVLDRLKENYSNSYLTIVNEESEEWGTPLTSAVYYRNDVLAKILLDVEGNSVIQGGSGDIHLDIEGQREETPFDGDRHPDTVNVNGERKKSGSNEDIEGQGEETTFDGDRHPNNVNENGGRRDSGSNVESIHREADRNQGETLNRPVLNVNPETGKYTDGLFDMLHAERWDGFISTVEVGSKDNEFNINCGNGNLTYLQFACFKGIEKVVKYLLDKGADLNTIANEYTNPPILVAGEGGKLDILKLILERDPKQLIAGKRGYNLLHAIVRGAVFRGWGDRHVNCLTYVLDRLKENYSNSYLTIVNEKSEECGTPLFIAVYYRKDVLVKILDVEGNSVIQGATGGSIPPEADRNQGERLNRPGLNVNRENDKYTDRLFNLLHGQMVDWFIFTVDDCSKDNEFNINCSDGIHTYLQLACFIGIEKVVKYLLDKGADLNAVGSKYTNPPILVAGEGGKLDILKLILERDPEQLIAGKEGYNLLHAIVRGAAFCGGGDSHVNCLTYVLDRLKENYSNRYLTIVNEKSKEWGTPLTSAVYCRNDVLAKILLDVDANSVVRGNERRLDFNIATRGVNRTEIDDESEEMLSRPTVKVLQNEDRFTKELFEMLYISHYDMFIRTIKEGRANVNCSDSHWNRTYLQYACKEGLVSVVECLLNSGADPNLTACKEDYPPVMVAAENRHLEIVKMIVERHPEQLITGYNGANILHAITKGALYNFRGYTEPHVNCLTYVLNTLKGRQGNIYNAIVNEEDECNRTPLDYAVYYNNDEIVKVLYINGALRHAADVRNLRNELTMTNIDRPFLLPSCKQDRFTDIVFGMFEYEDYDRFIDLIKQRSGIYKLDVNCVNRYYTYLQYACRHGLYSVVECLLKNGADPNLIPCDKHFDEPPIMKAANYGYSDIIKLIVQSGHKKQVITRANEGNLLHFVLCYMNAREDCLKYVLRWIKEVCPLGCRHIINELSANYQETPLDYALSKRTNKEIRMELLKYGANIGMKSCDGSYYFSLLDVPLLDEYLDMCAKQENFVGHNDTMNEIKLQYEFMAPVNKMCTESETLFHMSRSPNARQLLQHPIMAAFINIKWQKVSKFYTFIAMTYFMFLCLLTTFILLPCDFHAETYVSNSCSILNAPCVVFISLFLLMEILQANILGKEYWRYVENWVDILMIVTTTILISGITFGYYKEMSSVVILVTWTDFMLLLGRHPVCSNIVEMYKKVTFTFLRFLFFCSFLIFAFVLSYVVLYRDPSIKDALSDFPLALFNATLTITGHKDAQDIKFEDHPGLSYVLYAMFLVCIVINLLNLLNGLAVSDTQKVIDEAELVGLICRVNFIYLIEKLMVIQSKVKFGSVDIFGKEIELNQYAIFFEEKQEKNSSSWYYHTSKRRDILLPTTIAESITQLVNKDNYSKDVREILRTVNQDIKMIKEVAMK